VTEKYWKVRRNIIDIIVSVTMIHFCVGVVTPAAIARMTTKKVITIKSIGMTFLYIGIVSRINIPLTRKSCRTTLP